MSATSSEPRLTMGANSETPRPVLNYVRHLNGRGISQITSRAAGTAGCRVFRALRAFGRVCAGPYEWP